MQTDVALNVSDNIRHCGCGGSVTTFVQNLRHPALSSKPNFELNIICTFALTSIVSVLLAQAFT